jgi:hypothetical protein
LKVETMNESKSPTERTPAPAGCDVTVGPAAAQAKTQKAAKRKKRTPPARNDPMRVVFDDALKGDRLLKRKHRALFEAHPEVFRAILAKARGRVFRMKPGPPADPLISRVAREVALGARVEAVFKREFPHRRPGDEDLYAMALETFRGKVNKHIREHASLKRLRDRRKRSTAEPAQPDSAHD